MSVRSHSYILGGIACVIDFIAMYEEIGRRYTDRFALTESALCDAIPSCIAISGSTHWESYTSYVSNVVNRPSSLSYMRQYVYFANIRGRFL